MNSHPNYKGYDATKGNPNRRPEPEPKQGIASHIGPIEASDLYLDVPKPWIAKINAVRKWCEDRGIDFCPSPYPYQIAKVIAGDFTIVLWASKHKKHRTKFIKPAFEGPTSGVGADDAMEAIKRIVSE